MERYLVLGGTTTTGDTEDINIGSSCYLIEGNECIMVDCGLASIEGLISRKQKEGPNLDYLRSSHKKIRRIILTHGHLDHIGFVPGAMEFVDEDTKILASPQTHKILDKELSASFISSPEFGVENLIEAMDERRRVRVMPGENEILPGRKAFFIPNGHIPGSFSFILELESGKKALFMGDSSYHHQPVVRGGKFLSQVIPSKWIPDYVLSTDLTYTNERRKDIMEQVQRIILVVLETIRNGGKVIIPAFAVARSQNAAILISNMLKETRIDIPLYLDGGARDMIDVFKNYPWSENDITDFPMDGITMVKSCRHRQAIIESKEPCIVIAPSGMVVGGVVSQYLERSLPNKKDTVILISFQAAGTTGRKISEKKENMKYGEKVELVLNSLENKEPSTKEVSVNCKVEHISLSAHADLHEMEEYLADLIEIRGGEPVEALVLTHGTPKSKRVAAPRLAKFAKQIVFGEQNTILKL